MSGNVHSLTSRYICLFGTFPPISEKEGESPANIDFPPRARDFPPAE
jgi:hypothetical protein